MKYQISHRTHVSYAEPVAGARLNIRLAPTCWYGHEFSNQQLSFDPLPSRLIDQQGPYLVNIARAEFHGDLSQFSILSRFDVEVTGRDLSGPHPTVADVRDMAMQSRDLGMLSPSSYLHASHLANDEPAIRSWADAHFPQGADIIEATRSMSSRLHDEFAYVSGATSAKTTPAEAFAARHGVCQDFAHILIIALRSQGIAAAYASGYLRTVPPPGQQKLVGADAMHAWVNVWCGPDLGWVGFDPTNDCLVSTDHIQIAMGRDYADVSPIDGVFSGSAPQSMTSAVDVDNLDG